jgi:hypothetical protein
MNKLTLTAAPSDAGSRRSALVLERFSTECPIMFANNDNILRRALIQDRPFFDFVHDADEKRVRKALDMVKSWGVNERQQPSDGGFAFNRFYLRLNGRDSRYVFRVLLVVVFFSSVSRSLPPSLARHSLRVRIATVFPYSPSFIRISSYTSPRARVPYDLSF